jgi:hypothetical protein
MVSVTPPAAHPSASDGEDHSAVPDLTRWPRQTTKQTTTEQTTTEPPGVLP